MISVYLYYFQNLEENKYEYCLLMFYVEQYISKINLLNKEVKNCRPIAKPDKKIPFSVTRNLLKLLFLIVHTSKFVLLIAVFVVVVVLQKNLFN